MSNLKQIAKLCNISEATASRVISGRGGVKAEKAERILQVAEALNYKRNMLAHAIRSGRSMTVAVLFPHISNSFYPQILQAISDVLDAANYGMFFSCPGHNSQRELLTIARMLERRVDGFVVAPVEESVNEEAFQDLRRRQSLPVVAIDQRYKNVRCDFIGVDDRGGAMMATRHLVELGHRQMASIALPLKTYTGAQRLLGFKDALLESGLALAPQAVVEGDNVGDMVAAGTQAVRVLRQQSPHFTALVCGNDYLAFGAILGLKLMGLRVPEDISVVGFADLEESRYSVPPLTTVSQPRYDLGRRAAELLLRRLAERSKQIIEEPTSTLLPAELIVRASTARVSTQKST